MPSLPLPASLPLERNTRFFPARLNRKQFVVRWLLWLVGLVGTVVLLFFITAIQPVASLIVILGGLLYLIVGVARPRLKSAGLTPWWLLLWLVPVANIAISVLLFIAPPEKTDQTDGTDPVGAAPRRGTSFESKRHLAVHVVAALAIALALFFFPEWKAANSTKQSLPSRGPRPWHRASRRWPKP